MPNDSKVAIEVDLDSTAFDDAAGVAPIAVPVVVSTDQATSCCAPRPG